MDGIGCGIDGIGWGRGVHIWDILGGGAIGLAKLEFLRKTLFQNRLLLG